jgi:uncharacterized membrane protein
MTQSLPDTIERVPIEESLKIGWDGTKKHFWLLLGMLLVANVPYMICNVVFQFFKDSHPFISIGILWLGMAFQFICQLGMIRACLKIINQQSLAFGDLFSMLPRTLAYLGAIIIFLIAIGVGCLLLIVPGVIIGIKLQLFPYFIVDKNMGPIEALKASWEATKDVKLRLFLLYLVFGVVNTVGMLALIIGLVPAAMVVMIAQAFIYQRLAETSPETAGIPSQTLV